jgi:hypothetical protein
MAGDPGPDHGDRRRTLGIEQPMFTRHYLEVWYDQNNGAVFFLPARVLHGASTRCHKEKNPMYHMRRGIGATRRLETVGSGRLKPRLHHSGKARISGA